MAKYLRHLLWLPVAVLLGYALSTSNYVLLVVALAVVVGPLAMGNVPLLIYALVFTVTFVQALASYIKVLPRQMTWLTDILCLVLLMRLVVDLAVGQIRLRNTFITTFVYLWLALAGLGIAANAVAAPVFLAGLRNYFRFVPLLFVFSFYPLPETFLKRLVKILLWMGIIQLPLVIAQRVLFPGDYGDLMTGSFGASASGVLGLFEVMLLAIALGLYKSRYFSQMELLFYGGLVLLPSFISEVKIVFLIVPLLMILYLIEVKGQRVARNALVLIVGIVVFLGGVHLYNVLYAGLAKRTLQDVLLDPQRMMDFLGTGESTYNGQGEMPRVTAVNHMFAHISKDPMTALVGVGVGNATDSLFEASKGRYHKRYPELRDDVFAARVGWEFGYTGLLLFAMLLYKMTRAKHRLDHGPLQNGLLYSLKGMVIISAATVIYDAFLVMAPLGMLFWTLLGMANRSLVMEKGLESLPAPNGAGIPKKSQPASVHATRRRGSPVACN